MYDIVIIGGGLAGLCAAIHLNQANFQVLLLEKKQYPFHRVCGEYISNETRPYLQRLGLSVDALAPKKIQRFLFSSPKGNTLYAPLAQGGFGISRYTLDQHLYQLALKQGVHIHTLTEVEDVIFQQNAFQITTTLGQTFEARYVLGAYGKRSKLDASLGRDFFQKKSPYIGVKYHIHTDFPQDLIALHNFKDGYCGISAIEDQRYCLCYLTTRENLRQAGNIPALEEQILWQNPHLKQIFTHADFLYDKPLVINEISFAPKTQVENHILMLGDTAGLITPLCGNGMAIAMHSAYLLAETLIEHFDDRALVEKTYLQQWQRHFANRLGIGRMVQGLFGDAWLSELSLQTLRLFPPALQYIISLTHGKPF